MEGTVARRSAFAKIFLAALVGLFALQIAPIAQAQAAQTVTIAPSGDKGGSTDAKAFISALQSGKSIKLKSGATYYTDRNIIVASNTSITATGATIISVKEKSGAFRNSVQKGRYNYDSIKNFTVNGGYWKHVNKNGYQASMIQFTHGSNIVLKNLTVEGSFNHHAIEFIACKNVRIDGCNVKSVGACGKTSAEDAIQFDIAAPKTSPTVKKNYGSAAVAGQTCQDIVVNNCTVLGSRGITTNYTHDSAYMGKCHKNVTITNCKITAKTSEAVALFNAVGNIKVAGNTIVCNSNRTSTAYSIGLHFAVFGKVSKSAAKKAKVTVSKNIIKGGRQGLFVCSHATNKAKMGKFTVISNKVYCKKGKKSAIKNVSAVKFTEKKNKSYKWK